MTTLHDFGGVLGEPLDKCLLGCHNFMVTALGSCVKWPLYEVSVSRIVAAHDKGSVHALHPQTRETYKFFLVFLVFLNVFLFF